MKIKTIVRANPDKFDEGVNDALEKGYILEHRGLLPPNERGVVTHYAQLVLLEEAPEQEPEEEFDPFQALSQVKEFCEAQENCYYCPIQGWCNQLRAGGDPTDWELPEVEA